MVSGFAKWLKKYFIPRDCKNNEPQFIRKRSILVILALILFVETLFLVQTLIIFRKTDFFAAVLPDVLLNLTNDSRQDENLMQLTINPQLQQAAQLKANDMAKNGYFSHTSPTGVTPWYWLKKVGYKFTHAGENLAINFFDTADVNNAWLASPSHRNNILNISFTEMGIGIARGTYKGQESIFIVEFFGRPTKQKAASVPTKSSATQKPDASIPPREQASMKNEKSVAGSFVSAEQNMGTSPKQNAEPAQIAGKSIPPETPIIASNNKKNNPLIVSGTKELLSMPRAVTGYIFFIFSIIISLALMLKITSLIKTQYYLLASNGVFLLVVIFTIVLFNRYIGLSSGGIN